MNHKKAVEEIDKKLRKEIEEKVSLLIEIKKFKCY